MLQKFWDSTFVLVRNHPECVATAQRHLGILTYPNGRSVSRSLLNKCKPFLLALPLLIPVLAKLPIMPFSKARQQADVPMCTPQTQRCHYITKRLTVSCAHNTRLAHLSIKRCRHKGTVLNVVQKSLCVCVSALGICCLNAAGATGMSKKRLIESVTLQKERPSWDQG